MNLLAIDFSTLAGISAINVFITEAIVKGCNVTKNWVKQLISWATPLLLSIVGLLCQFGLFAEYGTINNWQAWVFTILTGLGLGLVSNGLFDIPFVQKILDWLRTIIKKEKKVETKSTDLAECGIVDEQPDEQPYIAHSAKVYESPLTECITENVTEKTTEKPAVKKSKQKRTTKKNNE